MKSKPVHLNIKSHPENLAQIREVLSKVASKSNLSKEVLGSIILAVDEACSNIIRHSYKDDHTCKIDLTMEITPKELCITIIDNGIEFDISAAQPRDITDIKPGGLGVYIINQVMDALEYHRTKDGYNQTTLLKKL